MPAGIKTSTVTKPARPQQTSSPSLAASATAAGAHRLFPLVSGAWFAALFGLGAVAAGGEALASLVAHLHLPAILPSAAPPLGTTAHILIAGALTGLGAAFGLVLGLVLHARARAALGAPVRVKPARETAPVGPVETPTPRVRNRDAHPDAPPRRPLVVTEDVLPYHAPAAPVEPQPEAIVEQQSVTTPPAWTAHVIESDSPLDHDETPLGAFMTPHPGGLSADHGAEVPPFFAGSTGEAPPLAQSGIYGAGDATVPPLPVEDAAPVFHAGPMPLASQAAVAPHEPIADVALGSLGLVQLIERLALAITVRQALREEGHTVATAGTAELPLAEPLPAEPLLAVKPARLGQVSEDTAQPAHSSAPLHNPFTRHDAAHDAWAEASDDHLPSRFLRSSGHAPADTPVLEATVLAPEEPHIPFGTARNGAQSAEARYSSLAGVAVVRPDQVVPFPVQTGETPVPAREPTDDADRALRDALATLRRMSAQR